MSDINGTYQQLCEDERIEFITFHPSYSYEEFIEGLTVNTPEENIPSENLQYLVKSGLFKNLCTKALLAALGEEYQDLKPENLVWSKAYEKYKQSSLIEWEVAPKFVLIIDEINRGDISKIFGELITLLEADKRLGADNQFEVTLPLSKDQFCVPQNIYIIATMNTSDRSISMMDIAVRRRFGHYLLEPNLGLVLDENINNNLVDMESETKKLLEMSVNALKSINERIASDRSLGSEKKIGHSYLFNVREEKDISLIWKYEILPLLEEYCYSNEEKKNVLLFNNEKKTYDLDNLSEFLNLIINVGNE